MAKGCLLGIDIGTNCNQAYAPFTQAAVSA